MEHKTRGNPDWIPGVRPDGAGREPGRPNKITRDLKHGLIEAAVEHGYDGAGTGGLTGYCRFLARQHPRTFANLLGKLIPLHVTGNAVAFIGAVNVVSVPEDRYLSADEIKQLSTVIEHEPSPKSETQE